MRGPKQIGHEMSEPVARYVLALLDVDDYEHSPNDYETAKLRRAIERQFTLRATTTAPRGKNHRSKRTAQATSRRSDDETCQRAAANDYRERLAHRSVASSSSARKSTLASIEESPVATVTSANET